MQLGPRPGGGDFCPPAGDEGRSRQHPGAEGAGDLLLRILGGAAMGVGRGLWSLYLLRDTPSTFPIAWLAPLRIFQLAEFSEPAPRLEAVEFLSTSTCNFRVNDFVGAWPYRLEPRDECERSVLWGRCNVCRDQRAVNRGRAERNSLRLRASVHDRGGPDASRLMVRERDGLPRPGPRADRVV